MIKRVLVLSDSLAAPRSSGGEDLLKHHETWPYLLRAKYPEIEVAQVSMGHATVDFVLAQCKYWLPFKPDLVLVQSGINDCIPRALHRYETEILKKLSRYALGKKIANQLHKRRIRFRDKRNINYTSLSEFKSQISGFKDEFEQVFFINLIYDQTKNLRQFANRDKLKAKVEQYNALIEEEYSEQLIDVSMVAPEHVLDDGFHLNPKGHEFVLSEILRVTKLDQGYN